MDESISFCYSHCYLIKFPSEWGPDSQNNPDCFVLIDRLLLRDLIIACASLSPEVPFRPAWAPTLSPGAPPGHAAHVQGCSAHVVSLSALPALGKEAASSSLLHEGSLALGWALPLGGWLLRKSQISARSRQDTGSPWDHQSCGGRPCSIWNKGDGGAALPPRAAVDDSLQELGDST